jgi:L,D-transpeptidase ErfK/SrfK
LRTSTGTGTIARINKNPKYINPVDNEVYEETTRDDGKVTKLPRIPWLDPKLDGRRIGQLIHPTTNPNSLGKAFSNGCIGLKEADAWRVYYYAPIGTKVVFRYDLQVVNPAGDTIRLRDIYGYAKKKKK